jgi:hypothetical protein
MRWQRLSLHDLRWASVDLLDEIAWLGRDNVICLPLAILWWIVSRRDVQPCKILVQSSVRGTPRTCRTRFCVDHHRTACRLASSVWRCMIEALDARKSRDLAGS